MANKDEDFNRNDNNKLDKEFYLELLHILGLSEVKVGSKKLIGRKNEKERWPGSLLENTIASLNKQKIPNNKTPLTEEQKYNVSLELVITWTTRFLFLKILESQLLKWHNDDPKYQVLKSDRIKKFSDCNQLFFDVFAKPCKERDQSVQKQWRHLPFIHRELFEPSEEEKNFLFIKSLSNSKTLPVITNTVVKDTKGKKITGQIPFLEYLFLFLDRYDFSGSAISNRMYRPAIKKRKITASIIGLVFEKFNGYKDGSFYTPATITVYMCRQTIRKAIVQKFNSEKNWKCHTIGEVADKVKNTKEASTLINTISLCDPAVGSGHFLVAALNEMLVIKSELGILTNFHQYSLSVENDELTVYKKGRASSWVNSKEEIVRLQKNLYDEKQYIISNNLFGVDINPNSVKICRLRLWIELLKSGFPINKNVSNSLPDITLNIKEGNSLISTAAVESAGKKINKQGPGNKIFNWKKEFPQLVNGRGQFTGFDIIIGNPPYGVKLKEEEKKWSRHFLLSISETAILFIFKGYQLLHKNGILAYIVPKAFTYASNYSPARKLLQDELDIIIDAGKPWPEVKLEAAIFIVGKGKKRSHYSSLLFRNNSFTVLSETHKSLIDDFGFILNGVTDQAINLAKKIKHDNLFISDIAFNKRGVGIQRHLLQKGKYSVIGGIDIERWSIKNTQRGFVNSLSGIEKHGLVGDNSVLVQNIVAHLTNPVGHIKIIAALPPLSKDDCLILDTINQLSMNKNVGNRFVCSLLNSRLINWYVYCFIYGKAVRTMHFDNVVTSRIPFPKRYWQDKKNIDKQINQLTDHHIYELFELTKTEIELIESSFKGLP